LIKENQRTLNQINGLTDVLILFPCMILAYFIRFTLFHGMPGHIGLSYYLMAVLCFAAVLAAVRSDGTVRFVPRQKLFTGVQPAAAEQYHHFWYFAGIFLCVQAVSPVALDAVCVLCAGNDRGGGQTMVSATAAAFVP
jgi:hypothetical protein